MDQDVMEPGEFHRLEQAMLVERESVEGYRLTPRCIAYLDECRGYEWRR